MLCNPQTGCFDLNWDKLNAAGVKIKHPRCARGLPLRKATCLFPVLCFTISRDLAYSFSSCVLSLDGKQFAVLKAFSFQAEQSTIFSFRNYGFLVANLPENWRRAFQVCF